MDKKTWRKLEVVEKFRSHFWEHLGIGLILLLVAAYNIAAIYGFYKIISDFFV